MAELRHKHCILRIVFPASIQSFPKPASISTSFNFRMTNDCLRVTIFQIKKFRSVSRFFSVSSGWFQFQSVTHAFINICIVITHSTIRISSAPLFIVNHRLHRIGSKFATFTISFSISIVAIIPSTEARYPLTFFLDKKWLRRQDRDGSQQFFMPLGANLGPEHFALVTVERLFDANRRL